MSCSPAENGLVEISYTLPEDTRTQRIRRLIAGIMARATRKRPAATISRPERVIWLSNQDCFFVHGQPALFVVQDGVAHLRKVGAGLTDGNNMETHHGIQPGDLVLVSGQHLLDEGRSILLEEPSIR